MFIVVVVVIVMLDECVNMCIYIHTTRVYILPYPISILLNNVILC